MQGTCIQFGWVAAERTAIPWYTCVCSDRAAGQPRVSVALVWIDAYFLHLSSILTCARWCVFFRNSKWAFLGGVKSSGAPPPRSVLVQQCIRDKAVLETLCSYVRPKLITLLMVGFCHDFGSYLLIIHFTSRLHQQRNSVTQGRSSAFALLWLLSAWVLSLSLTQM
jgi:hypothetical protein